jgi:hypothetical protein
MEQDLGLVLDKSFVQNWVYVLCANMSTPDRTDPGVQREPKKGVAKVLVAEVSCSCLLILSQQPREQSFPGIVMPVKIAGSAYSVWTVSHLQRMPSMYKIILNKLRLDTKWIAAYPFNTNVKKLINN